MKKLTLIYFLIISCLLFISINTYLVFNYLSNIDKELYLVKKVASITKYGSNLLSDLKDAETGQRGYLITKDLDYLKPYLSAEINITKSKKIFFKEAISLHFFNHETEKKIAQAIKIKLQELSATINHINNNDTNAALKIVRTNKGKLAMDNLKLLINQIISHAEDQIVQLESQLGKKQSDLKNFIYAFNFLIISTFLFLLYTLRKRTIKITSLISNVTQQKNELNLLTIDLQSQNENLLKYSHILSHDLRSPIQNFKSLVNLYEQESDEQEKQNIFMMLKQQCENLTEKIHQIIEELKLIEYQKVERQNYDVRLIIEKILSHFQHEIISSKTKIILNLEKDLLLYGSSTYFESILQNLISNALKYRAIDREPFIIINTKSLLNQVSLTVEDNGLGIDLDKHGNELFEIYKTFHQHTDSKGVGLHLVKKLVLNLGGKINVESTVNVGTKFIITIPKAK